LAVTIIEYLEKEAETSVARSGNDAGGKQSSWIKKPLLGLSVSMQRNLAEIGN